MISVDQLPSEFLQNIWDKQIRLRQGVRLQANSDGHFLVADEETERYFHCSERAYEYLESLQKGISLAEFQKSHDLTVDECLTIEPLLLKLINYKMLDGLTPEKEQWSFRKILTQPIAVKIPLFNPQRTLESFAWLGGFLFSFKFLAVFIGLLVTVMVQLPSHWNGVLSHWEGRFFELSNWVLMALAYVVLKALHEMAHGLAVTHYGGRVKEFGLFFIVFMPLPYVNTSASYLFPKKVQRVLVGCAGMQVEFALALLAIMGWIHIDPGLMRDFLFNVAFVGSFSTLIFNINPLMKFDGYYILSDLTGTVNLNERSKQMLGSAMAKFLFGIEISSISARGESWLPLYAAMAIPYRFFIAITIATYLLGKFFAFGAILAVWALFSMLVFPVIKSGINLQALAKVQGKSVRAWAVFLGLLCFTYFLIAIANFDFSSSHRSLATLAPESQIRTASDGKIEQILIADKSNIDHSQLFLQLSNPELAAELAIAKADLREFQASLRKVQLKDRVRASSLQEQIELQLHKVAELKQQIASLDVYVPGAGQLILEPSIAQGAYLSRGDLVGYLYKPGLVRLTVVVQQHEWERIQSQFESAEVIFDSDPAKSYPATLLDIKPAGRIELPSRFLGSQLGGDILVDGREDKGTRALQPFFELEFVVYMNGVNFNPGLGIVRINYQEMPLLSYILADIHKEMLQKLQ
ncbi:hypothetical protein [Neptuniibacter caesariensis]|uniref:Peptidase, M50 family protein n=1 Tax=Neptuniibacter caesariensis TaxID=207954 RepID=A0A7U8C4S7_NEPCE|nr:hypothetical protein [Neptuniibacter caesariensis]EAR61563.1 peptidase, M50 family protein [Oceanospirillum sp. MED92] [Neptuniibacter caesariensis]